ncbi:MAG: SufD family Fe-S cluster assembly protein [Bacillus subtilis]|nr:SufD family Fe-S cluster assembly protein [Bacillus subtilis]
MLSLPFLFAQVANTLVLDNTKIRKRPRSIRFHQTPNSLHITLLANPVSQSALTVVLLNQPENLDVFITAEQGASREANLFWYVPGDHAFQNKLMIESAEDTMTKLNLVILDSSPQTTTQIEGLLDRGSQLDFAASFVGGTASRIEQRIALVGEQAVYHGQTLAVANKTAILTIKQKFEHLKPFTTSEVFNYAVSNDQSQIKMEVVGKIHKGNRGSVCRQSNRGVILAEGGAIQVDPFLLIDEYDVEAGHGAAVGQINPDELYYMQSRGLDEAAAKRLIITGYVQPLLDRFSYLPFAYYMEKQIDRIIKGDESSGESLS